MVAEGRVLGDTEDFRPWLGGVRPHTESHAVTLRAPPNLPAMSDDEQAAVEGIHASESRVATKRAHERTR